MVKRVADGWFGGIGELVAKEIARQMVADRKVHANNWGMRRLERSFVKTLRTHSYN